MADTPGPNQLFEQWRKQFEEGAQAWARLVTPPAPTPPDPTAFWRPVLDQGVQTWAKLFAQTPATPELLTQWKQFLDQFLVAHGPMKKAVDQQVEAALQALNLPSRSQVTALAKQIVELEERIERLEDTIIAAIRRLGDKRPQ